MVYDVRSERKELEIPRMEDLAGNVHRFFPSQPMAHLRSVTEWIDCIFVNDRLIVINYDSIPPTNSSTSPYINSTSCTIVISKELCIIILLKETCI